MDERILDLFMNQDIVRRNAGLSRVDEFAEGDLPRGIFKICPSSYDGRTLSTKFKRYGYKVLRGVPHDVLSGFRASGEKDIVKVGPGQDIHHVFATPDDTDVILWEGFPDDLPDDNFRMDGLV